MDQTIRELITECMGLEDERKGLLMLMLLLEPPREVTKYFDKETLSEGQIVAKEEVDKLGGIDEVLEKYGLANKNYVDKFSYLAAFMDGEEGFDDAGKFEAQLNEEQFAWLKSHIREIKNFYRNIIS